MHNSKLFAIWLLLMISFNSLAAGEDLFNRGVLLFQQQKYQQAIKAFRDAEQEGLDTPALLHNLAACYYKIKNYPEAKKIFQRLRQIPDERMQAEYNLGLIAKKQNKPALAKKQFALVKNQARSKKLVTLAQIQLGELTAVTQQHENPLSVYASLESGHDSNITAAPDIDTATHIKSAYTSYYADGDLKLLEKNDMQLSVNASISDIRYSKTDLYGFNKISLGFRGDFKMGKWNNTLGYKMQRSVYSNINYQGTDLFEFSTKIFLTNDLRLRFRYLYYDMSSLDTIFNYLAGTRQKIRGELKSYGVNSKSRIYIEQETNNRTNTINQSFSPQRISMFVDHHYSFTDWLSLRGHVSFRNSQYPALGTSVGRDDTRTVYGLRLSYDFSDSLKLRALYEHLDNDSSLAAYTYKRDITALELVARF